MTAKFRKPVSFQDKESESVLSYSTHIINNLANSKGLEAIYIVTSNLDDSVNEWWIEFQKTEDGLQINSCPMLHNAFVGRFDTLNKENVSRDKLEKWKKLKNIAAFNKDFQKIIVDIPSINISQQLDRYTRVLKP